MNKDILMSGGPDEIVSLFERMSCRDILKHMLKDEIRAAFNNCYSKVGDILKADGHLTSDRYYEFLNLCFVYLGEEYESNVMQALSKYHNMF
jgi:hypothetical protein